MEPSTTSDTVHSLFQLPLFDKSLLFNTERDLACFTYVSKEAMGNFSI